MSSKIEWCDETWNPTSFFSTRIKPVNRKRARAFGRQAALCRVLPCCACCPAFYTADRIARTIEVHMPLVGQFRRSDPAHVPGRKMGGVGADDRDTAPLCGGPNGHHREYDSGRDGRDAFVERYQVDPREIANRIHEELQR